MRQYFMLFLLVWQLPAFAQIQFQSFEELVAYADVHAVAIQSAQVGEQISRTAKKEAQANLLPSINGSAGYNDNITLQPTLVPTQLFNPAAPEGQFEEFIFGRKYTYSTGVQAQWDVLNFQKIFASQTANMQLEESKRNTERTKFNTFNQLAGTYYSIVLTQEAIQVYEENVNTSDTIFAHAKEKFQQGIIGDAELNLAEIKQLQDKSLLNQAKNNLEQYYIQLQSQLNTSKPIEVDDKASGFSLEDFSLNSSHVDVRWQEAVVAKSQLMVKQQKASYYPSLSLGYQYNYSWATDDFFGFANANNLPQQSFGVQLNVPLFKGGASRHRVSQAEQELHLQQMQLENTVLVKQKEDELLQVQLEQASEQLVETRQILNLQEKNDQHARNRYESGIISLDERLNAYDDLLTAQDSYLQSLAGLTLSKYKIYIRQMNFQSDNR